MKREPVTDKMELLDWMSSPGWRTSDGVLRKGSRSSWYVERSYDCGYWFDGDVRDVASEVADAVVAQGLVIGKPGWGYRSSWEFVISAHGREVLSEWRRSQEKSPGAAPGARGE